jgi:hypothetical protein
MQNASRDPLYETDAGSSVHGNNPDGRRSRRDVHGRRYLRRDGPRRNHSPDAERAAAQVNPDCRRASAKLPQCIRMYRLTFANMRLTQRNGLVVSEKE